MKNLFLLLLTTLFLFYCETKKPLNEKFADTTKNHKQESKPTKNSKIQIFLNPILGKEYQFESRLVQKIVQKMDTISSETNHSQTIKYILKPISKDTHGIISFVAKFTEIEQKISSQMLTIQANSRKLSKEPTPLELFYSALIGKEFRFNIDERGRNFELFGVDSLIKEVIDQMAKRKEFKGIDKNLLHQIVGSFFNSSELKKSFEKLFEIYPERGIDLGESWKVSKHTQEPIPANIVNTFTLKSMENDSMLIDLVSNIVFEKQNNKVDEPKLIELSGKQNGRLIVDRATGLLLNSKLQQQIKIVYQVPPSQQTNNRAVNISTNINSTFYFSLK